MSKPAARLNDMHVCPMQTPAVVPIPHVGGPIIATGAPTVLIGGIPAACVGDVCICVGPPDVIAMGSFTVLMGGRPAARMGDMTAHGGAIVQGFPTVLIGDAGGGAGSPAAFTMGAARSAGKAFTRTDCPSQGAAKTLQGSPLAFVGDPNKKSWVEIELVDQKGKPVPYERYRIVPPNEKPVEGFLDINGLARVDGIDPGTCVISFPDLDAASWKPESGPPPRPVRPIPPPLDRKPRIDAASGQVRLLGRPGIKAGSTTVTVRAPLTGRPLINVGSVKVSVGLPALDARPTVQRATISLKVIGRPGVDRNSVQLKVAGRPGVQRDTVTITVQSRPMVNRSSIVLAAHSRPAIDRSSISIRKKP